MSLLTDKLRNLDQRITTWRDRAAAYAILMSGEGISADQVPEVLADIVRTIEIIDSMPISQRTIDHATHEWAYSGDVQADFGALRSALIAAGNRMAMADNTLWDSYLIVNTYPWAVTIPKAVDGVLAARLNDVVAAID